ncbi:MAG: ABC transporter substrate-binding protein [Bacillati bacterium ANGP1]|uniref:ABC transporter substrate-binding protein n=1 Tax=Candidatus Segetimicrobium genomatis TaxID=2569760 RepID=A0A537JTH1_9BACT|nr:MAG: ABC transporter substrate-binding protein [Terrabacteria group bacterium ANGP1]
MSEALRRAPVNANEVLVTQERGGGAALRQSARAAQQRVVGQLVDAFRQGEMSRRAFLRRCGALGVSLASAQSLIGADTRTPAAAAGAPRRGGILKAAFSADPAGFDPVRGPSGMSHVVIEQVYSTLMALDPDAKPYPELAQSYTITDDGLTYTFNLRKGVKFHHGDELTAEDVKFSFDRLRAPKSGYSYGAQVETIKSVDAVDRYTVRFRLSKVTGPFLIYMAFPGSSIVPKKLVDGGHDLNAKPIGTGPFKFVSYEPRSAIKFQRNPEYFETGKPYFDAMEYRIISDITALTNALLSGVVNFSNEIPPKDFAKVKGSAGLTAVTLEGSRYNWLLLNNTKKPFDNPKVRQAVSFALDRQALVDGAFFGLATPILGGVIPQWNWGYADIKFVSPKGDPAKSKALLAEAGYPNGITGVDIGMTLPSSFPNIMAMGPIVQANLAKAGIQAKLGTMEIPRYWDEVWSTSNFGITMMYWLSPLADPDDFVTNNYHCGMAINVQKYCSKEMDALLEQAKSAPTVEARKDLYRKMQDLSMQDMPIVPLVNGWLLIGHTSKLQNYRPMRTGFLKTLKDAWLEA